MALGEGVLGRRRLYEGKLQKIIETRLFAENELKNLGFETTNSSANFIFARHKKIGGEKIYKKLKNKGILVRHFNGERIKDFNRITVGTKDEMTVLIEKLKEIIKEETK